MFFYGLLRANPRNDGLRGVCPLFRHCQYNEAILFLLRNTQAAQAGEKTFPVNLNHRMGEIVYICIENDYHMKLLRYISVLLLCTGLTACGDDNPYTPEPTPPTPPTPKENIVFTLDGNLIRAGKGKTGDAVFNIDGDYLRAGSSKTGDIVFNIDGKLIRAGSAKTGDVVFNIDNNYLRAGASATGDIVYNMDGEYIRGVEEKRNIAFRMNKAGDNYIVCPGNYSIGQKTAVFRMNKAGDDYIVCPGNYSIGQKTAVFRMNKVGDDYIVYIGSNY
ncbi:MAG: hypothetical protein LBL79_12605 [Prevotella sp.]|jgi:hypothetical protein|nr:hypothetical protein [Prevotella sp.]